jgi:hypothetical protein
MYSSYKYLPIYLKAIIFENIEVRDFKFFKILKVKRSTGAHVHSCLLRNAKERPSELNWSVPCVDARACMQSETEYPMESGSCFALEPKDE